MNIKVFGTGCAKCKTLETATIKALEELNMPTEVEKVEDIVKIMEAGVLTTPALMLDGKVVVSGRVPSVKELKQIIQA